VGSILKELLTPGLLPDAATKARLGRLKEISAKYGCLQVAREIRDTVQRMPDSSSTGAEYKKNRGYDLACDLFLQHGRKRVEGSDSKAALFDVVTVAEEVQQCLFASNRHVKGIDLGLDLMECVLERASVGPGPCDEYLKAAQEVIGRSLEGALTADESSRASRSASKSSEEAISAPELVAVPSALLEYLSGMSARLRSLRRRLGESATTEPRVRLEYVSHLAQDAATEQLWGLAGRASEEAGALMAESNPGQSKVVRQYAFKLYEKARVEASEVGLRFVAHRFAQGAARVEA
jgi:hypothetical protein